MKKMTIAVLSAFFVAAPALAQDTDSVTTAFTPYYKYRVQLTDKKHNAFSTRHPEAFLSQKSIERRKRQGLKVNDTDLPITQQYVDSLKAAGVKICNMSKWNNTVLVQTEDTTVVERLAQLPFVKAIRCVATYTSPRSVSPVNRFDLLKGEEADSTTKALTEAQKDSALRDVIIGSLSNVPSVSYWSKDSLGVVADYVMTTQRMRASDRAMTQELEDSLIDAEPVSEYGEGFTQIHLNNAEHLHELGFRGKGMTIAIIDGGFYNADIIPMLKDIRVLGTRDFVETEGTGNIYGSQDHGMMVLSCIATNTPQQFIGTAPEAAFWLLRSEDGDTEQPVEEDNWCAAVEFADSVGVDLVNTSLGYSDFDNKDDNYDYYQLDGHHELCSNSASMLASKGIVLCCSAGNEADNRWKLISVPGDAEDVLTVGALNNKGKNTLFSSIGCASDGRIKPDVMAMGEDCTVLATDGKLTTASGTSFASPIMCGMVACYWQAHPQLTALQVVEAVRQLGDRHAHPDNVFGYGTPDFSK